MTYNNGRQVVKQRFTLFLTTFPLLTILAVLFWPGLVNIPVGVTGKVAIIAVAAVIYLFIALRPVILAYHYIYFSDDGNSILFRFYSTDFRRGIPRAIEIKKRNFTGYSINNTFFGQKPLLYLYENRKGKEAKYPPLCLSAVPGKIRERIYTALDQYGREK